jgi:predicted TIM-barrel fold metal-dependent hydrolase
MQPAERVQAQGAGEFDHGQAVFWRPTPTRFRLLSVGVVDLLIDAHAHAAGEYSTAESIGITAKELGIEKVVLCTAPKNNLQIGRPPNIPGFKTPDSVFLLNRMLRLGYRFMSDNGDGNQYVSKLRESLPDMVVPFLWVDPLDRQHLADLEQNLRNYQAKGIKLHQAWDPFAIDGPEFSHVVDVAKCYGLPVFIHLYSSRETWKLRRFVAHNPGVTFIIAHMLGASLFKEDRRGLDNVYFDTSGSERIRGSDIAEAVRLFGSEHVIFGSDTPYGQIRDQIAKIERLRLPDEAKEQIFRRNMQNILSACSGICGAYR